MANAAPHARTYPTRTDLKQNRAGNSQNDASMLAFLYPRTKTDLTTRRMQDGRVPNGPVRSSRAALPAFRWPTHKDLTFIKPPLQDEDLYDASSPNIDRSLGEKDVEKFLRDTYARLYDPRLDGTWDEALDAWMHCHNGLQKARAGEELFDDEVYHLAQRFVSLAQYGGDTKLGPRDQGKWFILPALYAIRLDDGAKWAAPTIKLGHPVVSTPETTEKLREMFKKAKVTVHLVNLPRHWAVLFYQPATGATCYVDSLYTHQPKKRRTVYGKDAINDLKGKCKRAKDAFHKWLEESGLPPANPDKHSCASSPDQEDGWSCGFQVMANILAFIRYEAVGWHRIPYWANQCRKSRRRAVRNMRREIVMCLHNSMGLRLGNMPLNAANEDGLQGMANGRGDQRDGENLSDSADGMAGDDFHDDADGDGDYEDRTDHYTGKGKRANPTTCRSGRITRAGQRSQSDAPRPAAGAALGRTTRAQEERARKQRDMAARLAELQELARQRSDAMAAALKAGKPYTPPDEAPSTGPSDREEDAHDERPAKRSTRSTTAGSARAEDSRTKGASGRGGGKASLKRKAADAPLVEGEEAGKKKQQQQPRGRPVKRKKTDGQEAEAGRTTAKTARLPLPQ
ncbi:uncharacterized protein B0T15DRAFT_572628 [Chaetomium strumarium]|uniref:Ubiquitin-like protease family profile domain-containing protein n=1 Tax=Chaetomium strumarium TaxID=1170767 RepID=A0AAJ0M490_9PEZI|nr:hypothetical protein B0T15DRAFT_572628 [Chaetomium strumarium]